MAGQESLVRTLPGAGNGPGMPGTAVDEPTQFLPVLPPSRFRKPPPPAVAARAVIVYEERPRRPWRLCVFTAVLVALTVGVVLGQAEAFERSYRSTASAQTLVVPPNGVTTAPVVAPPDQSWPAAEHRATAPLTSARTRSLEVVGTPTVLRIRGVDLGDALVDVATIDRSAVPRLTDDGKVARLELVPTGTSGTIGAEIRLNAKVAWTLRLAGGSSEQLVDMRAGRVAGVAISGGTGHVELRLPEPKGTVRVSLAGSVRELTVRTKTGTGVRLRLGTGADTVVVNGKTRRSVKAGSALTAAGWRAARHRYDVTVSDSASAILTTTY